MTRKEFTGNTEVTTTIARIDAAQTIVGACQAKAVAAALKFRDLDFGRGHGIVPANDPGLLQADAEAKASRKSLDAAKVAVRNLEADLAHETSQARVQAQAADNERRRRWVGEHRADLTAALEAAREVERGLLANPFSFDSPTARQEIQLARHRVALAREAIERATVEAPESEVGAHAAG